MSLWHLKQVKCDLGFSHKISKEAETKLFANPKEKIKTQCERCDAKLLLEIDPKNANYYIVSDI